MDGTIDFIILEHDDVAGCALIAGAVDGVVPAIDGYNTPYVVAKGYDHATRNWEDCTLFDDIVKAKLAYEGLRGREYSLDGNTQGRFRHVGNPRVHRCGARNRDREGRRRNGRAR